MISALEACPFANRTITLFTADHGFHLGEHAEFGKHTEFEEVTRVPLLLRVPGRTDAGLSTHRYTEHVDVFATLAELATGIELPACPHGIAQRRRRLCTMGRSFAQLVHASANTAGQQGIRASSRRTEGAAITAAQFTARHDDDAAFSQYTRGIRQFGLSVRADDGADAYGAGAAAAVEGGRAGLAAAAYAPPGCSARTRCTLGYSVHARLGCCEYRYTEWVPSHAPGGSPLSAPPFGAPGNALELYNLTAEAEQTNRASEARYAPIRALLRQMLCRGPRKPGGWGPWQMDSPSTRCGLPHRLT